MSRAETTSKAPLRSEILVFAGGGIAHTSGGVGTLMVYLLDAWAKRQDAPAVRVIDTRGPDGAVGAAMTFVRALAALAWACGTGRISLLHAHMTTRGSVVRKCILCGIANLCGVPTIIHQHGADFGAFFDQQHRLFRWVIRRTLNNARIVIVLGESWREFLIRHVGVRPGKIEIVLNGVPRPEGSARTERDHAAPLHILFLGRLGERKGVPDLIAVLQHPDLLARRWIATIAGDGDVERFRQQVADAGLSERIRLPGWQDRAAREQLLCQADILVLPSYHEAMPVAVIEALAHGIAVITTPVGVVPEFLADGIEALLVPPGARDRLRDALAHLLDDADARARLGRNGHAVFLDKLDIEAVSARMLALYEQAASPRPSIRARFRRGPAPPEQCR